MSCVYHLVIFHTLFASLFSLDGYNTDGSDVSSVPDLPSDILALRDSPTPFLCITDDNDVTHSPDSPGTPIHFIVRIQFAFHALHSPNNDLLYIIYCSRFSYGTQPLSTLLLLLLLILTNSRNGLA